MTTQDDRDSRAPLWRQPLLWAAGAAALLVVGGVGWMIYSSEELDARLGELDQASEAPTAPQGQDVAPQVSGKSGMPAVAAVETPSEAREEKSRAAQAMPPAASADREPGEAASSREGAAPSSARVLETPSSEPQEGDKNATAATAPAVDSPLSVQVQSKAPPPTEQPKASHDEWLKLNENGEPCQVILANGDVIELGAYGDSFEGYESKWPLDVRKQAQTVVDYERVGIREVLFYSIQLDVARNKMYWIEIGGNGKVTNIRRANLDGSKIETVLELAYQNPKGLAIDSANRSIYWTSHASFPAFGKDASASKAVWRATLDGNEPQPLFGGLNSDGMVAVEPASRSIYFADGLRLIRGSLDGSTQELLLDQGAKGLCYPSQWSAIDRSGGNLYWAGDDVCVAKIALDDGEFSIPVDLGLGHGHITGIALDSTQGKMYWTERTYQEIWRANLDGAQSETIAVGLHFPRGIAVDNESGYLYWTDWKGSGTDLFGLIERIKLPPPLTPRLFDAPPVIKSISPPSQAEGREIILQGAHFKGTKQVRFIGVRGSRLDAEFSIKSNDELAVVVPPAMGQSHAAIVVEASSGVTLTIPRTVEVERGRLGYDRFRKGEKLPLFVMPGASLEHVENALAYCEPKGFVTAGGRGAAVFFLKNGAGMVVSDEPGIIIYHEPFARIQRRAKAASDATFVPVPAIRPSFVESLFSFEDE